MIPAGNRTQLSSTLAAVPTTGLLNYDAQRSHRNRRVRREREPHLQRTAEPYDFENQLVQRGGVKIVYGGDGDRVQESVAGVEWQKVCLSECNCFHTRVRAFHYFFNRIAVISR